MKASHSSMGCSWMWNGWAWMPALLRSTSTPRDASTARSAVLSSETSPGTIATSTPTSTIDAAVSCSFSSRRPTRVTVAPSWAKARALRGAQTGAGAGDHRALAVEQS